MDFSLSNFSGHADFSDLIGPRAIASLSFRHCVFNQSLDLSGNDFHCIPDLTNIKLSHQVSLDGLTCRSQVDNEGKPDPKDSDKLCRLKEVAESNKNQEQALNFHIQEMRVKRANLTGLNKIIDLAFDAVSEYGRSVLKPIDWLIGCWYLFGLIYSMCSVYSNPFKGWTDHFGNGFLYATAQTIPFVAAGRETAKESAEALFGADVPNWLFTFSLAQGVISFFLIFLIGLALRNRFRI